MFLRMLWLGMVLVPFASSVQVDSLIAQDRKPPLLAKTLELDLGKGVTMKLVRIDPGKFLMGSPVAENSRSSHEHLHEVELTQSFYLGIYTVTQAQYRHVMGNNPSWFSPTGGGKDKVKGLNTEDFPVDWVSREDALAFCQKVTALTALKEKGWIADLPTEAEWEYACRAGSQTPWYVGTMLTEQHANFSERLGRTAKVGSYPPNPWGLYDMHGNVWQLCKDWHSDNYFKQESAKKDPQGPNSGTSRVIRGGCWWSCDAACGSARRGYTSIAGDRSNKVGFRVLVRPTAMRGASTAQIPGDL